MQSRRLGKPTPRQLAALELLKMAMADIALCNIQSGMVTGRRADLALPKDGDAILDVSSLSDTVSWG
jgi:hypothetical protein